MDTVNWMGICKACDGYFTFTLNSNSGEKGEKLGHLFQLSQYINMTNCSLENNVVSYKKFKQDAHFAPLPSGLAS